MTGLPRGVLEGAEVWRFMHPFDCHALRTLGEQMEREPGFVQVRMGPYNQWEECEVRTSRWTSAGASISVRRVPLRCAEVITSETIYTHVSPEAEEILQATARELEGTAWRDRTHPIYIDRYQPTIDLTHGGRGGLSAMPCMVRVGRVWKPVEVWTEPYPGGLAFCQFRPMPAPAASPVSDAVLPPLPAVVSA